VKYTLLFLMFLTAPVFGLAQTETKPPAPKPEIQQPKSAIEPPPIQPATPAVSSDGVNRTDLEKQSIALDKRLIAMEKRLLEREADTITWWLTLNLIIMAAITIAVMIYFSPTVKQI
jgi:hypothetical protein